MTFVNVATPLTAVTVVVPTRRPPVGALARLNVILSDEDVMVFPSASWTATRIGGEIVNPASTVAGSPVKNLTGGVLVMRKSPRSLYRPRNAAKEIPDAESVDTRRRPSKEPVSVGKSSFMNFAIWPDPGMVQDV